MTLYEYIDEVGCGGCQTSPGDVANDPGSGWICLLTRARKSQIHHRRKSGTLYQSIVTLSQKWRLLVKGCGLGRRIVSLVFWKVKKLIPRLTKWFLLWKRSTLKKVDAYYRRKLTKK